MKKFAVVLEGTEKILEVTPQSDHRLQVTIDGTPHDIDIRFCTADTLSLLIDNRSCDLSYSYSGQKLEIHVRNQYFAMEVLDEREMRMRRALAHAESSGTEVIRAFMPGKIVQVHVKPGDLVQAKAPILSIEAMKMENEIFSKAGGVVRTVHVKPGQTVENEALLVEIGPE